jgi:hypothetical protein
MEDAYRRLTADDYVEYVWRMRRVEQQRRNAWALIRYRMRASTGPYRVAPAKRRLLDDIKAALSQAFGSLAVVLVLAAAFTLAGCAGSHVQGMRDYADRYGMCWEEDVLGRGHSRVRR